jgi:galactofuranosylgalactofuranosylrhamnosyl-N-acetylglucosaminyl-diphospho-decaprenol beta-1,5/1,6-galactofuranosyltransferase
MQDVPSGSRPSGEHGAATTDGAAGGAPMVTLQRSEPRATPVLWGQAFPAAIWRRILGERTVTVSVDGGRASLLAAHDGRLRRLGPLAGGRDISLAACDDDWLWVEGDVRSVTWTVPGRVELPPVTAVIPTYRRERDALAQARRFLRMDAVTSVLVVDQGGTLRHDRDFTRLLSAHESLHLFSQPNLGGSGGYARGMIEASQDPSAAVLFSDDDAALSEESLRRMLTYQALSARPTIVGTPLFSAARPARLITHTEKVGKHAFQWRSADHVHQAIDLTGTTPVDWTFLSSHEDANYTGWWGTLFPPGTASDLGLPAPLFLKWDDAEYGLRATAHGYDHAVLPGTAVHHPPWTAYRTQMTWTARVLHRNRLAIAAAYDAGRGVIGSSLLHQAKHVLAGHLLTAELWEDGIDAVRAGPESWLGHDLQRARADGSRVVETWHRRNDLRTDLPPTHDAPLPLPSALVRALARVLRPDGPARVVLAVPADDMHWRATLGADALLVTDRAGAVEAAFAVRGSAMRRAAIRSLRSHLDLALRWRSLRARYREALPRHATTASWRMLIRTASDRAAATGTAPTDCTDDTPDDTLGRT